MPVSMRAYVIHIACHYISSTCTESKLLRTPFALEAVNLLDQQGHFAVKLDHAPQTHLKQRHQAIQYYLGLWIPCQSTLVVCLCHAIEFQHCLSQNPTLPLHQVAYVSKTIGNCVSKAKRARKAPAQPSEAAWNGVVAINHLVHTPSLSVPSTTVSSCSSSLPTTILQEICLVHFSTWS